jgi:hypothetical protein
VYLSRTATDSIPYADATESLGQPARTTENNAFPSRAAQVRYLEDTRAAAALRKMQEKYGYRNSKKCNCTAA